MDIKFGPFCLKHAERQVLGPQGPVELSARGYDILAHILTRPDQVIRKDELLDLVWPNQIVGENTLHVQIAALRKALGADILVTVHGQGYKYTGPRPISCSAGDEKVATAAPGHKPLVVVLPFGNLSNDPEQQFFSEGITGDITDRLARFGAFAVIGQHSAASLGSLASDLASIRELLKVDFVVTGTVQRSEGRIRIAIRLSDAADGRVIWGERYDRPMSDLFALQDELSELVAAGMARHLEVKINARSAGRAPTSLSSYEYLLQGYWNFKQLTRESAAAAKACFERSIELDPGNAEALGWLGVAHCEGWIMDFHLESALKALEFTSRGISLDPTNARCHTAYTWASLCVGDLQSALQSSERGLSLNPSDPNVLVHRAITLGYDGRTMEAKNLIGRAFVLEPIPPLWFGEFKGVVDFANGEYQECLAGFEPALKSENSAWDQMYALACCGLLGHRARAESILARSDLERRSPDWDLGISLQPFRDPAVRDRLAEGVSRALAF